jgi:hypothetical protein
MFSIHRIYTFLCLRYAYATFIGVLQILRHVYCIHGTELAFLKSLWGLGTEEE